MLYLEIQPGIETNKYDTVVVYGTNKLKSHWPKPDMRLTRGYPLEAWEGSDI